MTLKNGLDHLGKLRQLGKMCINTCEGTKEQKLPATPVQGSFFA